MMAAASCEPEKHGRERLDPFERIVFKIEPVERTQHALRREALRCVRAQAVFHEGCMDGRFSAFAGDIGDAKRHGIVVEMIDVDDIAAGQPVRELVTDRILDTRDLRRSAREQVLHEHLGRRPVLNMRKTVRLKRRRRVVG
jgi:hypothetical protein